MSSSQLYTGDPARLAAARASAPPSPAARAHQPPAQRWPPAVSGSRALGQQARVLAEVRSRRRAPRQPAAATRHARARSVRRPARSAGAPAAEHAAALWQLCCRIGHDDDGRLPGGRLTRALPPRANGHDGGAWCEGRNRAASARWGPRSPGHPASRLHPHALRRAAFDNIGSDRRGLRARHADTHAQPNTHGARGLKMRRSPSIGRASRAPEQSTWGAEHHDGNTTAVPILLLAPRSPYDLQNRGGGARSRCGTRI